MDADTVLHLHGTFYKHEPPKHRCELPTEKEQWPDGFDPNFWECGDCGQVYEISIDAWTGWWSPDTDTDTVRGEDEYGHAYISCKWEIWVDCPPNIHFTPRKPNNLGVSGIIVSHPNPGKRPDYLPLLPQNRRLYGRAKWTSKTTPVVTDKIEELVPERRIPWFDRMFGRL